MSALPPKADIAKHRLDVCFGPKADILRCNKERHYSITSSAMVRLFSEQTFKNLATATTMSHLSFIQCSDLAVKLRQLAASLSIFSVVGHGMELEVLKTKRALARAEWPKSASIAGLLRFGGRQYAIKLNAFSRARQPTEVDPVCHRFTANPLEREE